MSNTDWFATTPEAILRAESILVAFEEGREHDIGAILAHDQDGTTDPLELMVALVCIGDRLADYGAHLATRYALDNETPRTLIREAARTVSEAVYVSRENRSGGDHGDGSPEGSPGA